MMPHLKVVEPETINSAYVDAYHEIAVHVRDLLRCDYVLVAIPDHDAIRIKAIAGAEAGTSRNLAVDLFSKLRDWGPVVVDDSRLVAVPVLRDDTPLGLIVGYSLKLGRFTGEDLEKLMAYGPVAAAMMESAASETAATKTNFTPNELLHFSRLITIGELSACFAHEVTNPLMLIRGHVRFVQDGLPQDHPLRLNFEVIERASRRIEEMAKRMLDFSRKRAPRTELCDVAEVIADAIRFVQPYFRTHNVDVQVHMEQDLPAIDIDRWQVVQAVVNLLQNAADSMEEQEKRLVSITVRVEGATMRLAIADTGKGIAPSHVARIFEPFFTTKGECGTGLGLYITRQVIEDHGGNIDVRTGNRGTTFVISLPL
jgi:signal transduction histidine kinase